MGVSANSCKDDHCRLYKIAGGCMYCRWTIFKMEIKRLIGMLPLFLLETLLFGIILSGIGVYASKALYGDKAVGEIKVGIVAEGEEALTRMLVHFVQSMDSLESMVSFELLPEEEARTQMEEGEIDAVLMVPEGIVDSIISGENLPVTILLGNSYNQIETEVFAQLTRSGAKLLTTAQAGIYAADTLCAENGMPDRLQQTEDYLNAVYLKYALGRTSVFRTREVNAVKGVRPADYYGISLLLAFLSLAGLSFGGCLQVKAEERKRMIRVRGISAGEQYLIGAGAFAAVLALLGMLVSLPVYLLLIHSLGSSFRVAVTWIFLAAVWAVLGAFLHMLFQIAGNSAGGTGVCFVILLAIMSASGVFLPSAFLPLWVEKIGSCFPYKGWMDAAAELLQGRFDGQMALKLLAQLILFLALGALAAVIKDSHMGKGKQTHEAHEKG